MGNVNYYLKGRPMEEIKKFALAPSFAPRSDYNLAALILEGSPSTIRGGGYNFLSSEGKMQLAVLLDRYARKHNCRDVMLNLCGYCGFLPAELPVEATKENDGLFRLADHAAIWRLVDRMKNDGGFKKALLKPYSDYGVTAPYA